MHFFNPAEPIFRSKQSELDYQDQVGLIKMQWRLGERTIFSRFYTRIDQIFVLWGVITGAIFGVAQFCPISWTIQAWLWSTLTGLGILGMVILAWFWASVERLRWVICTWAGLMTLGLVCTNLGILGGWWSILLYLCPLWLGLSALGYLLTAIGMHSRAFLVACGLHLFSIPLLPYTGRWQLLVTGLVMAGSLLFLSEVQWDMRPPVEFAELTPAQRQHNQHQHQLRQLA
ncbi:MAG: hypothetical protein KME07_10595 [Pegethrix bostrychoides GSE-TBD4-15B]|jgi:hypothetical protein|uniref:Uncharacterized protein n=1 Tax=Pegethrix bostrychoides GSE-TBD4-15B TaxID=2839662 RepID=A0A951U4P4_9CYAN|nr:hypothetical protein [Pegethrix bostrychoides GSE-TBD4-15B]